MEEKQRQYDLEQQTLRQEQEENEAIRRYLIQVESEDAIAKRKELLTLRNDWHLQQTQQEHARERELEFRKLPVNVEGCGVGAAQTFQGEDPLRHERTRLQAMQLREWTEQQLSEKQQRKEQEKEENIQLGTYVADIERLQDQYHQANERERAHVAVELQQYNQHLQEKKQEDARKQSQVEQALNAHDIAHHISSHLVSENPIQAHLNGTDHRVRVDHWKGLSVEQTRHVLSANEQIKADKERQQQAAKQQEQEEARRQGQLNRILAQHEHETQLKKAQQQLDLRQTLDQQTRDALTREQKNAQQARGAVDASFFQAFGKSYR